jgi:hypothetical protein
MKLSLKMGTDEGPPVGWTRRTLFYPLPHRRTDSGPPPRPATDETVTGLFFQVAGTSHSAQLT